ncbi:MAG: hypothetical protein U9P07_02425 [Pseudomonadota bacterium]|nr:hypothetical protein [Pseudomonadota bacterium]
MARDWWLVKADRKPAAVGGWSSVSPREARRSKSANRCRMLAKDLKTAEINFQGCSGMALAHSRRPSMACLCVPHADRPASGAR